jgi:hypothetical protein
VKKFSQNASWNGGSITGTMNYLDILVFLQDFTSFHKSLEKESFSSFSDSIYR